MGHDPAAPGRSGVRRRRADICQTPQAVDGSANLLTAAICQVTGGQPASVCASSTIVAEKAYL